MPGHPYEAEEHTLKAFDEDMNALIETIKEMGKLTIEALGYMRRALNERDSALVDASRALDDEINARLAEIDRKVTSLLALQKPVAVDLRFTLAALRIAIILERVGDIAKNNIKKLVTLEEDIAVGIRGDLDTMIKQVSKMIRGAIKGFNKADMGRVEKVWEREERVDELFKRIFTRLKSHMTRDKSKIAQCAETMLVVKNLERMGDSATDIIKIVEYVSTGQWGRNRQ